jgi:hypothetical protein
MWGQPPSAVQRSERSFNVGMGPLRVPSCPSRFQLSARERSRKGQIYPVLSSQLLQNLFPQLLRFPKKLLILHKQPVQLQRLIRRELPAQNHIPHMHRIRQSRILGKLFQRRIGIVMIHAAYCIAHRTPPAASPPTSVAPASPPAVWEGVSPSHGPNPRLTSFPSPTNHADAQSLPTCPPHPPPSAT